MLENRLPASSPVRENRWWKALFPTAALSGQSEVVQALIKAGANLNQTDKNGAFALTLAAWNFPFHASLSRRSKLPPVPTWTCPHCGYVDRLLICCELMWFIMRERWLHPTMHSCLTAMPRTAGLRLRYSEASSV